MRYSALGALLFSLVLTLLPASGQNDSAHGSYGAKEIRALKEELLPLDSRGWLPSESEEELLRHYFPEGLPGSFRLARFPSKERELTLYHFRPERERPAGFIYLLHGYLDHTLSNVRLIAFLLEQGYEVAGFDLPGHGLSEGDPVDIDDFTEYAAAFEDLLGQGLDEGAESCSVVAHSTGCSMVMEYLKTRDNQFDKIILASPLVYSVGWWITGFGISLAQPFSDHIFRRFSNATQDEEYAAFVRNRDPFQSHEVPFSWVRAYLNWNRDIRRQPVREDLHFHILQGNRDSVVDYKMNIPFLMKKYPLSRVIYYEDGMHSLFNEHEALRRKVYQDILVILQS